MTIKIGINGFGRIGRMVLRATLQNFHEIEVVGINDLLEPDYLAYMLKFDSVHGRFQGTVSVDGHHLVVNGKKIRLTQERDPAALKWNEVGADIVVEATGLFLDKDSAEKHLAAGAKKVLMSAPSKDDTPMFVYGVNHATYKGEAIISNASCTTNCLAPMAKVLDEEFGIVRGLMTTVHAYTNDQSLHDQPHKDLRRARAGAVSIIPTSTGAAKAISLVLPNLKGKLDGYALRVPVPTGSATDLTVELAREVSAAEINAAMKKAAEGPLKGILKYTEDPIVSADIVTDPSSCIFDAGLTKTIGSTAKVLGWYDNEWGYSNRLVDLVNFVGKSL